MAPIYGDRGGGIYGGGSRGFDPRLYALLQGKSETDIDYENLLGRSGGIPTQDESFFDKAVGLVSDINPIEALINIAPGGAGLGGVLDAIGMGPPNVNPWRFLAKDKTTPIQEVLEKGEDNPVMGPAIGTLGRVFDVLSRGQFASANVAGRQLERGGGFVEDLASNLTMPFGMGPALKAAESVRDAIPRQEGGFFDQILKANEVAGQSIEALGGEAAIGDVIQAIQGKEGPLAVGEAWRGISGQKKGSYQNILQEEGVQNPAIAGAQGFALDVLLDPLSFVDLKITKGASKLQNISETARYKTKADKWLRRVGEKAPDPTPKTPVGLDRGLYAGDIGSADKWSTEISFQTPVLDETGSGVQEVTRRVADLAEDQSPLENAELWRLIKNYGSNEIPLDEARRMGLNTEDIIEGQAKGVFNVDLGKKPVEAITEPIYEEAAQAPISNAKIWNDILRLGKGRGQKVTSYEDLMDAGHTPEEISQAFREVQERGIGNLMEFDDPLMARRAAREKGWIPPSDLKPGPGTGHGIRGTMIPEERLQALTADQEFDEFMEIQRKLDRGILTREEAAYQMGRLKNHPEDFVKATPQGSFSDPPFLRVAKEVAGRSRTVKFADLLKKGLDPEDIVDYYQEGKALGIFQPIPTDETIQNLATKRGIPVVDDAVSFTFNPESVDELGNVLKTIETAVPKKPSKVVGQKVIREAEPGVPGKITINPDAPVTVHEFIPPTETVGRRVQTVEGSVIVPDLADSLPSRNQPWADPVGDYLVESIEKGARKYVPKDRPLVSSGVTPVSRTKGGRVGLSESASKFDPGKPPHNYNLPPSLPRKPLRPPDPERGYVALRFGTTDLLRSYKAYELGRAFLKPVLYNSKGQARLLNKAFRMQASLPEGTDQILRKARAQQMAEFDERMRGIKYIGRQLSEEQRRHIAIANSIGENLTEFKLEKPVHNFQTLEDVRQFIRGSYDEIAEAERLAGIKFERVPDYQYLPPRIFRNKGKKAYPVGQRPTLDKLVDSGEIKVDDVDAFEFLLERAAKTSDRLSRADFNKQVFDRFGVERSKANASFLKDHRFVKVDERPNTWLPPEIYEAYKFTDKLLTEESVASEVGKILDKAIGEWKFWVTQANPGHHIRNMISDIVMNAQDGVMNPVHYNRSARIIKEVFPDVRAVNPLGAQRHVPGYVEEIVKGQLRRPDLIKEVATGVPTKGTTKLADKTINLRSLWDAYVASGSKSGFTSADVQRQIATLRVGPGDRTIGRAKQFLGDVGDAREDYVRLAHFLGALDDELSKRGIKPTVQAGELARTGKTKEAIEAAGQRVRKWNIDYGKLTPFERRVTRRIIPFYSFMRFNLPNQLELLFTKPGFMSLYPKGTNLINGFMGTDTADDQLLPRWIRELAPFRIQHEGQERKGPLGWALKQFGVQPGEQALADITQFPVAELSRFDPLFEPSTNQAVQRFAADRLSEVNPLAKAIPELAFGKQAFSGQPIDSLAEYALSQVPAGRLGYRGATQGSGVTDDFARWLTGFPIRQIGEPQQRGEFRAREDIAGALFNRSLAENLPEQYGQLPRDDAREVFRQMYSLNRQ